MLLGDSVFDNGAYTNGGPDVVTQLDDILRPDSRATLVARDGSTTADMPEQVSRVPKDATHLVLSVGGNDALLASDVLAKGVSHTAEGLLHLSQVVADFEQSYRTALSAVFARNLPTVVCTVYNGRFEPAEQEVITTAVRIFDDCIFQAAWDLGLPVIDLRRVCREHSDYANEIEPSSRGGLKIARAIVGMIESRSQIWPLGAAVEETNGSDSNPG